MRKRWAWQFLAATAVLAVLGVVLTVVCLRSFFGGSQASNGQCEKMIAALEKVANPDALRIEAKALAGKYPSGAAHRLDVDERTEQVKRVMEALGLGEAAISDDVMFGHRILTMSAPGGFASYGVKVVPLGMSLAHATNAIGLKEMKWNDGIYVFCAH
jgi:hypothetical protein